MKFIVSERGQAVSWVKYIPETTVGPYMIYLSCNLFQEYGVGKHTLSVHPFFSLKIYMFTKILTRNLKSQESHSDVHSPQNLP